jgi:hypothetical protein
VAGLSKELFTTKGTKNTKKVFQRALTTWLEAFSRKVSKTLFFVPFVVRGYFVLL